MAVLRQFAWSGDSGEDPAAATFASGPVEGNLLVALASERSGNAHSAYTIDGTGWTKADDACRDVELANGDYRRNQAVWYKIAGASEPTTVTVDNGTTSGKYLSIHEYEPDTGDDDWTFLAAASNDNGTTSGASSIATGTTASVSGDRFLEIGFITCRNSGAAIGAPTVSWTNGLAADEEMGFTSNAMKHGLAHDGDDATEEAKSSTASNWSTDNTGLTAGILVFSLIADAFDAATFPWPKIERPLPLPKAVNSY